MKRQGFGCGLGKLCHVSRKEAVRHMEHQIRCDREMGTKKTRRVYWCTACEAFHVGHRKQKTSQLDHTKGLNP
jgi:hypothetical protein